MPQMLMTDRGIAGLKTTDRRASYFDTHTRGLALRANQKTRTWYYVYRTQGGAPQWLKLGTYPALSLVKARAAATDARGQIDKGIDPIAERKKALEPAPAPAPVAKAFTFRDFAPVYVKFQQGRTKHWPDEQAKIARYILPAWGDLPLRSLTRTHVHELLDTVAAKGVSGKGLTAGVNRLQALISRMCTVALDRHLIDAHPAARLIKRFKEIVRDRVLSDAELVALEAGLTAQPGAAADALRLRLLLGQRGAEVVGLTWAELELEQAHVWELPRTRAKNGRPHVVPLPPSALTLLARRRAAVAADEPRVFPGLTLTSLEHKALGGLHGIGPAAYQWKDLRRTCATRLAELGVGEDTIGRLLNHAKHSITGKHYNQHDYLEETRAALRLWDLELERILAGKPKARPRVVAFHGGRRRG